jgi:penicillin-binding protein 1C
MWSSLSRVKPVQWTVIAILSTVLIYFILPPGRPFITSDYSTVVTDENGKLLHVFVSNDTQWHLPPDTVILAEKLVTAVITYEDESFYRHIGVDFSALARATYQNLKQRRITSGASTIPMQVARMCRPKKRTYYNKVREIFLAVKLSLHYSKDEILKLYLDHAPYGGNVIGYRTASLKYYGKEPASLTWSEAATLAVLPNAPGLIYPSGTSGLLKGKRDLLLDKLHEKGAITEQTLLLAKLEPVPDRFLSFPSHAPHIARKLRKDNPMQSTITTTLSLKVQTQCNQIANRYKQSFESYGVHNLAILVADTKSGSVKAYVGSPDFFDFDHGGQVDGVISPRSGGSILKPFLYALCIDDGLIVPDSFVRDLPTYFEGFSPQNANNQFQGVVTAREALVQSLNIPAVRLLNSYGVFQFYSFLKAAGVSTLFRTADEYGLPLILGGSEVNMWDMVMLYRGLANNGIFSDNHLLAGEVKSQSSRLISSGSSYLTLEMLKDLKRPGSEYYWERFSGSRPFSWKTGTSFGHKDAWAVGVNPDYTIAVWVGNFSGESNKNLSGATSAGPVLFDILQALPNRSPGTWFARSLTDFRKMEICRLSGFRATDACSLTVEIEVPYGMKPLQNCEYHQFRFFSTDGKYQTCSQCWHMVGSEKRAVELYPPDVAYYLREKGYYILPLPRHYPQCPAFKSENALKIIYPNMEAKLFVPRDFDGSVQSVVCRAGHSSTGTCVYWYLNDSYLGMTTDDHKMAVRFNEGWNTLKVIDENGAYDSQKVFATFNPVTRVY